MSNEQIEAEFKAVVLAWAEKQREIFPGERAELRRVREPQNAVICPGFWRLYNELKKLDLPKQDLNPRGWICYLAVILSHQKENVESICLPQAMGQLESGKPRVSNLRFRRLMSCETLDELFVTLLRTLSVFKGRFQFSSLFNLLRWHNDQIKREWAIDYYQAGTNKEPS